MDTASNHDVRLRSGNQMAAEGALRAGCRFFAGYPITPASGIFKSMIDLLPSRGGLALSAPDEISAIAYCIGASMRGVKAMTATSGPGFALMTESLQYALMTETPLVLAFVQRLGPSTGGATQGAQGDVLLAEFFTSGGYTVPVLCPSNALECYELTMRAFAWSEQLRTPVIVLSDKEVGMTTESIDYATLPEISVPERAGIGENGEINGKPLQGTYYFTEQQDIPRFVPVGGDQIVTATGSAHDKKGKLQKNSPETLDVLLHLEEKIRWRAKELELVKADLQPSATKLVISYGITSRAAKEAIGQARKKGARVSFLGIQSLFPVPAETIRCAAKGVNQVIIPEENLNGLYRSVLERYWDRQEIRSINKVGSMITPQEIESAILE